MICASIDIGTNTVLLLVAKFQDNKLYPLVEKQRIPRLGKGVDEAKKLDPDSIQRVLNNLLEYKEFLDSKYPGVASNTIVAATSAVRDASNRSEILNLVKELTGWEIQLLSGPEEAEITYKGALSVLNDRLDKDKGNLVLDIGGGSSELAFGHGYELRDAFSLDMGSVRFTERFFKDNPPSESQTSEAVDAIQNLLKSYKKPVGKLDLIGAAGTVTSIAAVHLGLKEYDVNKLNGFEIKKSEINRFIENFSKTTWQEIETQYPTFLKGRGEVILAGLLIMREVMNWCGEERIVTSTGGIRHGVLLSKYGKE